VTTALITLGRMPKGLALARCLKAAGCRVIVADPVSWHICRGSRAVAKSYRVTAPNDDHAAFLQDLLTIVREEAVDLILPVSEEALYVADLRPQLPLGVRLLSPVPPLIAALHDKWHFIALAEEAGLPVPKTALLGSGEAQALAAHGSVVVKPRQSCSGIGLAFLEQGAALPTQGAEEAVVQERLEGETLSSFSLVREGKVIRTVVYRGRIFVDTVAVAFERLAGQGDIHSWIERFAAKHPFEGFLSFDFMRGADGAARAIECNPRLTSGIHFLDERALGLALIGGREAGAIPFVESRKLQQFFPALTSVQGSFFTRRPNWQGLRPLFGSRDVLWSWQDPLPLLLMTPLSAPILWRAIRQGISLGEAATADIARFSRSVVPPPGRGSAPSAGS